MNSKKGLKILTAILAAVFAGYGISNCPKYNKISDEKIKLAEIQRQITSFFCNNSRFPEKEESGIYQADVGYALIEGNPLLWSYGIDGKDDIGKAIEGKSKWDIEQIILDNSMEEGLGYPFYWFGNKDEGDLFIMINSDFREVMAGSNPPFSDYFFSSLLAFKEPGKPDKKLIEELNLNITANFEKNPEKSVKMYEYFLSIDKDKVNMGDYGNAHFNLGLKYFALGRYDESLQSYLKSVELNPKNAAAYNNLGVIYHDIKNENEKARECWKKALELGDKNAKKNIKVLE